MKRPLSDELSKVASCLFCFLVERFPVMCGSDEFHFLPRIGHQGHLLSKTENLDPDHIRDTVLKLRNIRRSLESIHPEDDLESIINKEQLKSCISGVLIELEEKKSWQHNPLLYLKIAFIGLEQAFGESPLREIDTSDRVKNRLLAIPDLIGQAKRNIRTVPETYYNASLSMIKDCINYMAELKDSDIINDKNKIYISKVNEAIHSLRVHLISSVKIEPDYRFNYPSLEATMRERFQTKRSLNEVFEIGLEEWEESSKALLDITGEIGGTESWKELYSSYSPLDSTGTDIFTMYREETEKLRTFFEEREFGWVNTSFPLVIAETPLFLRSIRGSASFSASAGLKKGDKDHFYITTEKNRRSPSVRRLHREYKFLSAHEAFPGHQLLDSVRRSLENPVRRFMESPLFYEGWAYYAESLLEEDGYIQTLIEKLVHRKRSLWRAARCMIDAGIPTGHIDREKAVNLLEEVLFTQKEAEDLINRFQLNPGYHLCYTLGRFEILRLRNIYGKMVPRETFHSILLKGGELPFNLAERRLQTLLGGRGD